MKKYDNYKDTNVSWFGKIPENWEIKRIKDVSKKIKTGSTPSSAKGDYFSNGVENWFTPVDINNSEIVSSNRKVLKRAYVEKEIEKFPANSIYLIGIGGTLGKVAISRVKAGCNQQINVIIFNKRITSPDFAFYQLLTIGSTLIKWSNYTTMPIFTQTDTKKLLFLLPSNDEQTVITQYLNSKTQAIDKKVKLLEQKIQYYKELRKSIINKAVTKGLDDKVELKESGINWIGKIPKHWEIKRFKDSVKKYTTGATPSTSNRAFFEGTYDWICISDISKDKYIFSSETKLTDDAIKSANMVITPSGSLLYSFKLSIGKVAFAGKDVYTNEAILSIFPNKLIDLEYYYFMLPIFLYLQATENIYGAKMLNQKLISSALVVNPPKNEQIQIAQYLNEKISAIDRIEKNIEIQITTFKELRKTLINNVVTGKIKVTND